jgi:1-acyl-sn-glycerol-3-phosphate acyltransferase
MRVKMHDHVDTLVKQALIAKKIREDVRDIIYNQLVAFDSNPIKSYN